LLADHTLWVRTGFRQTRSVMEEPTIELIWDLLVFLVLVAVGLVVLNLLARRR
jgi:hypothetical protein